MLFSGTSLISYIVKQMHNRCGLVTCGFHPSCYLEFDSAINPSFFVIFTSFGRCACDFFILWFFLYSLLARGINWYLFIDTRSSKMFWYMLDLWKRKWIYVDSSSWKINEQSLGRSLESLIYIWMFLKIYFILNSLFSSFLSQSFINIFIISYDIRV